MSLCQQTGRPLWEYGIDYEMARSGWSRNEVIDYMTHVIEIMEQSARKDLKGDIDMNGIIYPTAGKVEAHLKYNKKALDMEKKVELMLTTSVIGIVMSKDCNYSAELYGCQVEPEAASAMAAALVFLMDGS
ncbi:L-serine deaminase [[Eubacterium] contortum]|uniref:L-serine ammonia-lyase n=1 Tax=Faecalicatena contorta TaxID=39482 RepID=A0A174H351_9FIRM|nr:MULTISPECIES: L-serine ammonia-lyase, iron-sulfur-dependent, subunit alpha [Clostridia]CUO67827.1 L-serine deaminase [[Eubacterium] contortum] [Faecalicatena contorta]